MSRIVILGGGFGGLTAAHVLLPALARGHSVILVDRKDHFFMGLSKLWVLVGQRSQDQGRGDLQKLQSRGIRYVQAEVRVIDTASRTVHTTAGPEDYDHLIIALGADVSADAVPGLPPQANLYDRAQLPGLHGALLRIRSGTVLILVCASPYKCPPAPFEAALLVHGLLRERGVRDEVQLEVAIPDPQPMPVAGPAAGARVRELLDEQRILLHGGSKTASVDAPSQEVVLSSGKRLHYDLLLAIPPHRGPRVAEQAGLSDASSWIPVDPATLATTCADVYAVGDVNSIRLPGSGMLPKVGIMAELQAEVVAANLLAQLEGRTPERTFNGEGYCFFETGEGQAMLVEGRFYAEPGARARFTPPSKQIHELKQRFERERLSRWFDRA